MTTHLLDSGSIRLLPDFVSDQDVLFKHLATAINRDTRIRARKAMSFGLPYNYSGIEWPATPFPDAIRPLLARVAVEVGFAPNNCLANYYETGDSTMGFHSDSVAELESGTGIVVVSLGVERTITFRRIDDKGVIECHRLPGGSLLWMCPKMQREWKHAILADARAVGGRISLTFRRMKS